MKLVPTKCACASTPWTWRSKSWPRTACRSCRGLSLSAARWCPPAQGGVVAIFVTAVPPLSSFGPVAVDNGCDEVVADERRVEVGQHVGVHRAESGTRSMLHTCREGLQDALFEVRSRV